jgi:hypothetical protein
VAPVEDSSRCRKNAKFPISAHDHFLAVLDLIERRTSEFNGCDAIDTVWQLTDGESLLRRIAIVGPIGVAT